MYLAPSYTLHDMAVDGAFNKKKGIINKVFDKNSPTGYPNKFWIQQKSLKLKKSLKFLQFDKF